MTAEPMTAAARIDELTRVVESNTERINLIVDERDRLRVALNAADAMNGVHQRTITRLREQLEQAQKAPGPTGLARVWSGYDDDECWFPAFASLADAKAYAERAYRAQCEALNAGDPGEITWSERKPRTEAVGYPDMFDLETAEGSDGWVVCGMLVHASLASGLTERPIGTDDAEPEAPVQITGQQEIPAPRGYRIGDVVRITGRGELLDGRTGPVAELDDDPEFGIGIRIEGFLDLVWCNSAEIRHLDAAEIAAAEAGAR